MALVSKGLEGIVANESRLSNAQGNEGLLTYCGHNIDETIEVFVSYSHSDKVWLERLQPLLKFDNCRGYANEWDDQKLQAGDKWKRRIREALDRMNLFVCLISTEFLLSRYVQQIELPKAFEREEAGEIEIVPIVVYRHVPIQEECPKLLDYNPLPRWDMCWRDFEGDQGDYGDAHGLIRAGLKQAIERLSSKKS